MKIKVTVRKGISCLHATDKDVGRKIICVREHSGSMCEKDLHVFMGDRISVGEIRTLTKVWRKGMGHDIWKDALEINDSNHVRWKGCWIFYDEE